MNIYSIEVFEEVVRAHETKKQRQLKKDKLASHEEPSELGGMAGKRGKKLRQSKRWNMKNS